MGNIDLIGEEIQNYSWPACFADSLYIGEGGFYIDFEEVLANIKFPIIDAKPLVFSVLTEDYLQIFNYWLFLAKKAGFNSFLIGYIGSPKIGEYLRSCGVGFFRICLPESFISDNSFRNKGGFSAQGAAVIYSRILVAERIVSAGFDLLCCDVDAWILRPCHLESSSVDIAFQRVAYFPLGIVEQWGFALCGGFVFYRSSNRSSKWLQEICMIMREVSSDQLALNLAMLRQGVVWNTSHEPLESGDYKSAFRRNADLPIYGEISSMQITLLALPATLYWRHDFVEPDRQRCIMMHPNSSKFAAEKLQTLKKWSQEIMQK